MVQIIEADKSINQTEQCLHIYSSVLCNAS